MLSKLVFRVGIVVLFLAPGLNAASASDGATAASVSQNPPMQMLPPLSSSAPATASMSSDQVDSKEGRAHAEINRAHAAQPITDAEWAKQRVADDQARSEEERARRKRSLIIVVPLPQDQEGPQVKNYVDGESSPTINSLAAVNYILDTMEGQTNVQKIREDRTLPGGHVTTAQTRLTNRYLAALALQRKLTDLIQATEIQLGISQVAHPYSIVQPPSFAFKPYTTASAAAGREEYHTVKNPDVPTNPAAAATLAAMIAAMQSPTQSPVQVAGATSAVPVTYTAPLPAPAPTAAVKAPVATLKTTTPAPSGTALSSTAPAAASKLSSSAPALSAAATVASRAAPSHVYGPAPAPKPKAAIKPQQHSSASNSPRSGSPAGSEGEESDGEGDTNARTPAQQPASTGLLGELSKFAVTIFSTN